MSQRDSVFGHYGERYVLNAGVTIAIPPIPGQNGIILKYISGGSLSIFGASFASFTLPSGAVVSQRLYTLGTSEVYSANYQGTLYIQVTGATGVFELLRHRSEGFGSNATMIPNNWP